MKVDGRGRTCARMEIKTPRKILFENSERNRFVCKVGDNIMADLNELWGCGLDSTGSAQGPGALLTYGFRKM
jgi:hypothetical protein